MVKARGVLSLVAAAVLSATGSVAAQPPAVAPLEGAAEVVKITTPRGFIDDVVATDEQRLAYVVAETATRAELHVFTHATGAEQVVDLAPITLQPVSLSLLGSRVLVVGRTDDGNQVAGMIELAAKGKAKPAGSLVYKLGPASHITLITRAGKPRIAVHAVSTTPGGTRHEVELVDLASGKRIAAARPLELDASNHHAALELRVNHWSDGMTRAHGIKAGAWDPKEDQRAPDLEAVYDLVSGKLVQRTPIADLFEQRRRFQGLAAEAAMAGNLDFVTFAWDHSHIQLWRAGKPNRLELDQPIISYDPKSLQGVIGADGSAWIVLKVDPVNVAAVERKKADPEYLDVFQVAGDGTAVRKARVLAHGVRHRFGVVGRRFWLLERTNGFERGGRSIALYDLR
jgi:hypothetical protein